MVTGGCLYQAFIQRDKFLKYTSLFYNDNSNQ